MPALIKQQRSQLRQSLRAARRELSASDQCRSAQAVLRRIRNSTWLRRAHRVGLYMANDGELDAGALLTHMHRLGKQCFLPVLPGYPARLRFARYAPSRNGRPLVPGRFGIAVPRGTAVPAARLDVVFVPLVAFARNGARLGRGGGFYDRALAARAGRPEPLRVGLAHALQEVAIEHLPSEVWDVQLHVIVTPDEVIHIRK